VKCTGPSTPVVTQYDLPACRGGTGAPPPPPPPPPPPGME
jgi:hypothetical protein